MQRLGSQLRLIKEQKNENDILDKFQLLENQTFNKFLKVEQVTQYSIDTTSSSRTLVEINKLKSYFLGLQFFEKLKRERDNNDFVIQQCCKELKYRKYNKGDYICKFGEEGSEFYIIMKGTVSVLVPQQIEMKANIFELHDYIRANEEFIIWEKHNKYLHEQYQANNNHFLQIPNNKLRKTRTSVIIDSSKHTYEFTVQEKVIELGEGKEFGELALLQSQKKLQKRAATILCNEDVQVALLSKQDFENVIKQFMLKQIDAKVEFLKNFRLTQGITKTNLEKLTYYLKEKTLRRRDCLFKEGEIADGLYFIREGEFEISITHTKQMFENNFQPLMTQKFKKTQELRLSIVGQHTAVGIEDLVKDNPASKRTQKVACSSEKGMVYFLSREDYFKFLYKQIQKKVILETTIQKNNFMRKRLCSLQDFADKSSTQWLKKKKRFLSNDKQEDEELKNAQKIVKNAQNEELSFLLQQHKLMKSPLLKNNRISSKDIDKPDHQDFHPNRHSKSEYFLQMAELYNNLMFNMDSLNKGKIDEAQEQEEEQQLDSEQIIEFSLDRNRNFTNIREKNKSDYLLRLSNSRYQNSIIVNNEEERLSDSRTPSPQRIPSPQNNNLGLLNKQNSNTKSMIFDPSPGRLDKTQSNLRLDKTQSIISLSHHNLTREVFTVNHISSKSIQKNISAIPKDMHDSFLNKGSSYNQTNFIVQTLGPLKQPKSNIQIKKKLNFQDFEEFDNSLFNDPPKIKRYQKFMPKPKRKVESKQHSNKLTLDDIKAHLIKSQKNIMQQLQERMEERKLKQNQIQTMQQSLQQFDKSYSQTRITQFPNLISQKIQQQNKKMKIGTKSSIYFNMFIQKR